MLVSARFSLVCFFVLCLGSDSSLCSSSETLPSCKHISPLNKKSRTPGPSSRKARSSSGDRASMPAGATALDFREMLRKEREASRKPKETAEKRRYLSSTNQRPRLHLERNHRVTSRGTKVKDDGDSSGNKNETRGVDGIYYVPNFVAAEEGERLLRAVEEGDDEIEGRAAMSGRRREWKDLHKRRLQIHGGIPSACSSGMVEEKLPLFLREVCDALVEAGVFPEDRPPNHVLLNEYSDGQGIGPHKDGPLYDPRVAILSLGEKASLEFWETLEDAEADCAGAAGAAAADLLEESDQGKSDNSASQGSTGAGKDNNISNNEKRHRRSLVSVECEHCSLVVFEGRAYRDVWHGIAAAASSPRGNEEDDYDVEKRKRGGSHGKNKKNKRLSFTVRRVVHVVGTDTVVEHPEARSEMERRRRVFERSVAETAGREGRGVVGNLSPPYVT